MPKHKLEEIVKSSKSIGEILSYFDLQNKGSNFQTLTTRLKEENIDYSHIVKTRYERSHSKIQIPKDKLLCKDSKHSRNAVKRLIIKENLIDYHCEICGIGNLWNDTKLVLVLDHKNGISNDNRIENLRFLCPNCNSQQSTFAGKNVKKKELSFCNCGNKKHRNSKCCNICRAFNRRKVTKLTKEELEKLINKKPVSIIAKELGISGTVICRWCKSYQITTKPRGFWQKLQSSVTS